MWELVEMKVNCWFLGDHFSSVLAHCLSTPHCGVMTKRPCVPVRDRAGPVHHVLGWRGALTPHQPLLCFHWNFHFMQIAKRKHAESLFFWCRFIHYMYIIWIVSRSLWTHFFFFFWSQSTTSTHSTVHLFFFYLVPTQPSPPSTAIFLKYILVFYYF